jgi:DNA-binding transcriptional ArsR family regulator
MVVRVMSETLTKLDEACKHLQTLIALFKLSNRSAIRAYRDEIGKDEVSKKILDLTVDPLSYSELIRKVSEAAGISEVTVKRKIPELREMGLLATMRQGREVLYENTGLLD